MPRMVIFKGGADKYIPGIPTRDIPEEEWMDLPKETRELAVESGVYDDSSLAPKRAKKESDK